ncbi:MAG TPA: tRNA (adenosine(37)-N6)-threonylcarbamoyltransferase complex ATPase subunit type 1 TsaE [Xanthobacteraceae bacterium]|nr:tRNA (adenosine(37)-N6)-threonylcarbamoyltransferase complex ATPase subunit type 1 TsaE [Xanthobacteraceae bacterium]
MMLPAAADGASFSLTLADEAAMHRFMRDIAIALQPGDLITLSGDLGAGKTTFARALIRHLAGDETIEVPSPTFTLMQTYELAQLPIIHADLYRIAGSAELAELGFDDLPENAIVLLEWPDRAAGFLPPDRLDIAFTLAPQLGEECRNVRVTGYGAFAARAERIAAVRKFLDESGFGAAERRRLQGDASTRSYERLVLNDQGYILMNAPRRSDGPPVRDGKPYSAIAHLAEDVTPFVAMAAGLRSLGLSAPGIYFADNEKGLLILEDLGDERIVEGEPPAPIEERYQTAVDLLAALHAQTLPQTLPVSPRVDYRLPRYDIGALLIEVELLADWYLPRLNAPLSPLRREAFVGLWRTALQPALDAPRTWVLRDFHSPNLLWLPEREGIGRIGLLDFQDAVLGPAAYDLASLLQDARVDVPEALEIAMLGRYARQRRRSDPSFDTAQFVKIYAIMAAQRATKILGIFARLDRRDGKPQYLRHMPRLWNYLQRSLAHPSLASLKAWYGAYVPALKAL